MDDLVQEAVRTNSAAGIIALVIGVIVVLGLIAAFVLGSRRKEKEPPPSPRVDPGGGPTADGTAPDADSWSTPPETPGEAPGEVPHPHHAGPDARRR